MNIERPDRWVWESTSPQETHAKKFVDQLKVACKNEDAFISFYQAMLTSVPDWTMMRATLRGLVMKYYTRTTLMEETRQEHKNFKKKIEEVEQSSIQQKKAAARSSVHSRKKKVEDRDKLIKELVTEWKQKYPGKRGAIKAVAVELKISDSTVSRAVFRASRH